MEDKVTKGMLGYISLVALAIITAVLLNYFGVVDLSDAYNWF
jgi:hypothetical protein